MRNDTSKDDTSQNEPVERGTVPPDDTGAHTESGAVGGLAGMGSVGAASEDMGAADGTSPEDEQPVTIEDDDDPDALAHRGDAGGLAGGTVGPNDVGPEMGQPS